MSKKALRILLVVLVLVLTFAFFVGAEEVSYSGTCGENVNWMFDQSTGTLTISGTGPMANENRGIWSIVEYRMQITRVVIEKGVTTIGKKAFFSLSNVRSAEIPDSVTRIEEDAFNLCSQLQSIQLPDSVQYIGKGAFGFCTSLNELVLPESLWECASMAFECCTGLTSVTIPNSLEKLPSNMFAGCSNLTSITIPSGVRELASNPFDTCSKLSKIIFEGDAPVFHPSAFGRLTAVAHYPAGNGTWTEDKLQNYGGSITWLPKGDAPIFGTFGNSSVMTWNLEKGTMTITGDGHMDGWASNEHPPWYPYRGLIKKVVFSGKIENIYSGAFRDCTELTEVVWTPTIKRIFSNVFKGCSSLKTITIPDTVQHMGSEVFYNCKALQTVNLGKGLEELDPGVFAGCTALKSLTVPPSVNALWSNVFKDSAVEALYFQGNMPAFQKQSYDQGPFGGAGNITVYYAANNNSWTTEKIREVESWSNQGNIKFVATEELNQYTQVQQVVKDPELSAGSVFAGNMGSTTGTKQEIPGNNPAGTPTARPNTPDEPQLTADPTESTVLTQTDTTKPLETTENMEETIDLTTDEKHAPSDRKTKGTWIVWLIVGLVVAADAVAGVIYLKKRKSKK